MITWDGIKEVFFAVGSLAGVFAFVRPWVESRAAKDLERVSHVKAVVDVQQLVDLEVSVYSSRSIYSSHLYPFSRLTHETETNRDEVRFSGPMGRELRAELDALLDAYRRFREYIQVPEWEPGEIVYDDGTRVDVWQFNKSAFEDEAGIPRDYADHLHEASRIAVEMRKAFYRFQIVSDTHLFEMPFARWLLPRKFKQMGVEAADTSP